VSDLVCLEHGLSVIEPKPYDERDKRAVYPKPEKHRDKIRAAIDQVLQKKPKDFDDFLRMMEEAGYEVKRGKNISLKGKGQQRFIRLRSLGEGYSEEEIRKVIAGSVQHKSEFRSSQIHEKPQFNLLIDIQERMKTKGPGYQRWATVYNLKQMSETFLFMREHHVESFEDLYRMRPCRSSTT